MRKIAGEVGTEIRRRTVQAVAGLVISIVLGIVALLYAAVIGNREAFFLIVIALLVVINLVSLGLLLRARGKPSPATNECKSGSIVWFCRDSSYALSKLNPDNPQPMLDVIDGLEKVHHHAIQLRLDLGGAAQARLTSLWQRRDEAIAAIQSDWSRDKRSSVFDEVANLLNDGSLELQQRQKDFIASPSVRYKPPV